MLRKFAVGLAALGALNAAQVKALGLGEVTVHSALNQPLNAEIDLLQIRDLAASQIITGLADSDEFYLAGVKPTTVLSDIRFELDIREGGGKIRLSTREPIREPFLNFLVEVNWPSGRLVREYTVLLDPPVFTAKDLAPRSAPPVAPVTQRTQTSPVASSARTAPAPLTRAASADTYRVGNDDTLWSIALKTRPGSNVSPQQMMLALQRANPGAFIGNNINLLKSGSVLRIPTAAEVASLGSEDPVGEVNRQNAAWRGEGNQKPVAQGGQLDGAATDSKATAATESDASRLRIVSKPAEVQDEAESAPGTLVADETQAQEGGADPVSEELLNKNLELEEQLVVTLEGLDKVERDNAELFQRLDQLGNQMASLQRLLELKDQQLAELQVSLNQAQTKTEVEAAPAPVVQEESGPISALMAHPASLAGALAALLALVGGGLLFARKRKQKEEQEVDVALAELDAREGEGAAQLKAAGAVAAGAAAAVAASQAQADALDDMAVEEDPSDPFNLASEDDQFDSLTSDDLDASLGDDLDMDLKIDEPIEEDPEMAEFAASLLSDDDYDLGAEEAAEEDAAEAESLGVQEEDQVEATEEEEDDLDFLLADQEPAPVVNTVETAPEDDDDLDFILGGSATVQDDSDDAEIGAGTEPQAAEEDAQDETLDDLDALLGMNVPEEAETETETETETVALEPEVAAESMGDQEQEHESELLGELDELLDDGAGEGETLSEEASSEEALSEESGSVLDDGDGDADALDALFDSPETEAADLAAEQTGEPVAAPEVEEDRDAVDQLLAEAGADAGAVEAMSPSEAPPLEEALEETDLDALFASFGDEEAEEDLEQQPPVVAKEAKAEADPFEDFSLELEDDGEPAAETAGSVEQTAALESAPEEDLDLAGDEDLEAELNLMLEEEGNGLSLEETALGELDSETDYLEGADEVGTKLDLARAYIDMDDSDGARDILDEVLQEGSASQVEEAKQLMAALKQ